MSVARSPSGTVERIRAWSRSSFPWSSALAALALGGERAEIRLWPWFGRADVPRRPGLREALAALPGFAPDPRTGEPEP